MSSEILPFQDLKADSNLLRFLDTPSGMLLPAVLPSEHDDPLGLVRHEKIHNAAAERIYNGFSYVCEQIINNDPAVRAQLREHPDMIEFPKVAVGPYHVFGLRHQQDNETGRGSYELYRADEGNPEGGFFVIKRHDGSVILKREDDDPRKPTPDYAEIISTAQRGLIVYAHKRTITRETLEAQSTEDHLDSQRLAEHHKQAKRENRPFHRATKAVGSFTLKSVNTVVDFFHVPGPNNLGTQLSKPRVIAAALLLPLPFFSERLFDSPVPRPASIEILSDTYGGIASALHQEPKPDLEKLYDQADKDLSPATQLTLGREAPIAYVARVSGANDYEVIEIGDGDSVYGTSPRRLLLSGDLGPNKCDHISVDPEIADNDYSLATTNREAASNLTVGANQDSIYVCNETGNILDSDALDLYFDSIPR